MNYFLLHLISVLLPYLSHSNLNKVVAKLPLPTVFITGNLSINQCETNTYTISIQNNTGNPITDLVITGKLLNLTGFSYISGTSAVEINSGIAFCTTNPTASGNHLIWDIDGLCPNSPFTLKNGDVLNISFILATDCTAVTGSLKVDFDYKISGTSMSDNTGVLNIQVNPGEISIKKTPNIIPQVLGQNVTWTLTVENTGFGVIENVEITDVLGAGLAYVSSTESGSNSGQTTTWTSNEFSALASMNPGDMLTMNISAQVIACENLENLADVRFGCNPSPSNTCFDTSVDGGTANATLQRIVRSPNLSFTPPDINFIYCDDVQNVSITITNIGDGIAYDSYIIVDFTGFTVSNVSAGAVFNVGQTRFELTAPLAASGNPGDSYNLSFDLTYNTWCGASFPGSDLIWQSLYKDECDQEYYHPVELSCINPLPLPPNLSVSQTGGPTEIQIGESITYTILSSYYGPLTCDDPNGSTGMITVVDNIPHGFNVTNAGGGTWIPGTGGTGGTVSWTYTPPALLNTMLTIQSPGSDECETYCNTSFTNTVTASVTDCCGCTIIETDSQTTNIKCAQGLTANKSSSSPTERCDQTSYTNTFIFDGGSGIILSDLVFTEEGQLEQKYVGSSLSVIFDGNDISGLVLLTDNTPTLSNDGLILDFTTAGNDAVAGKTLTISYDLTITERTLASCTVDTFYSWSALDLGSGTACLSGGVSRIVTKVIVGSPEMTLDISGLGSIYNTCETKPISMTLTQISNYNPRDVKLVLSGHNYYVVNPGSVSCDGVVAPVSCLPVINGDGDYVWTFDDNFTANGANATITMDVQKRCTGGGDLEATVYYDDRCTDDDTSNELCSAVATITPALLLRGDLLIEKNPETYYATTNTVVWEIYLTNRGTGTAYNVWVDDVLGSGLFYLHGVNPVVVDNMDGVTINDALDHHGGAINGVSIEISSMAAGERRQITLTANLLDCNNLTNDVSANWGCITVNCQTEVTDNSIVQIPVSNLINTNSSSNPIDACGRLMGFISLKNTGQVYVYNLQVTETLPTGLTYVSGTTRWRLNGGGWIGPNVIYDPSPTTSPLVWTSSEIPQLSFAAPGDNIEIEFDMVSDCSFSGGDIIVSTLYENPCTDVFNTSDNTFTINNNINTPDIIVNKTRANDPIGCNEAIQWTITVQNNSDYTIPIIWVEDRMDAAYSFVSAAGGTDGGFNGYGGDPQLTTWELQNLTPGTITTLTLNADTDSSPCNPNLDNTVTAYWGCGASDGKSDTKPGVDPPDEALCLGDGERVFRTETRKPKLDVTSINFYPLSIDACNDITQITVSIENSGPVDAFNMDLVITLPAGLSYHASTSETGLSSDYNKAIDVIGAVGDPAISGGGSILTWYDIGNKSSNIANTIQANGGNDTQVLRFSVQSSCYTTSDLDFDLYYYDCCDDSQYTTSTQQQLSALFPTLSVTKTPTLSQINCNSQQSWTISVINHGTGNAEVVRVEVTPGAWIDVRTGQPGDPTDMGGGVYGWEVNNIVGGGGIAVFTLVGTLNPDGFPNQNDCSSGLRQNNVQAIWGCGSIGDAIDGDPTTTTDYDCEDSTPATATAVILEMPNLVITSITPNISCLADGNFSNTLSVRVTNSGDGLCSPAFTVQLADGVGGVFNGTYAGPPINAGAFVDVAINMTGWSISCCTPYAFVATVDTGNTVCECNETDNSNAGSPVAYRASIPELNITDIDLSNITCSSDGISGSVAVSIQNTGCGTASNFNVALTTDGCLSFSDESVASLAAGISTTVTFPISGNWANCTIENCQFMATIDSEDEVCECDGTNNTRVENYSTSLPDLVVTSLDFSNVSCSNDNISGSVRITILNQGYGSASNFEVSLATDGCLTFPTNNIIIGPLTNGQNAIVDFPITNSWSNSSDCACEFTATVDTPDAICECDGTNNTLTTTYNNPLPDLKINTVSPTVSCNSNGYPIAVVNVNVSNMGCSNANDAIVRLSSDCGFVFSDQVTSLNPGANTDIMFNTSPSIVDCNCSFIATIDPDQTICESTEMNNRLASATTHLNIPDLLVDDSKISITCVSDGKFLISGSISVQNNGCGANLSTQIPVRFTLYDQTNCSGNILDTWIETLTNVDISSSGGIKVFSISDFEMNTDLCFHATDCKVSLKIELDYSETICEFDKTNNNFCVDDIELNFPDLSVETELLSIRCLQDGKQIVAGSLTVKNTGCGTIFISDIPVRFTLIDGISCVENQIVQWTETLNSVNVPAGGELQTFTITSFETDSDLSNLSSGGKVSILIELDFTGSICECNRLNNTYCKESIGLSIPDLMVNSDGINIPYGDVIQEEIIGEIVIMNQGFGAVVGVDLPVKFTLFDNINCTGIPIDQWTEIFSGVQIPAHGGSQPFDISPRSIMEDICAVRPCDVTLKVEVDYLNEICEINGENNAISSNYIIGVPIPTLSQWGLNILLLLLIIFGFIILKQRRFQINNLSSTEKFTIKN